MRRFFAVTGIAAFLAALAAILINKIVVICIALAAILLSVYTVFLYRKTKLPFLWNVICVSVGFVLFCAAFTAYDYICFKPYENVNSASSIVKARVVEEPIVRQGLSDKYTVYTVEVYDTGTASLPNNFKARITASGTARAEYNDTIFSVVSFNTLSDDYRFSEYSDGVCLSGKISGSAYTVIHNNATTVYGTAIKLRKSIRKLFIDSLGDEIGGIPIAILLGDKAYISNEFYSAVKLTGLSHVLAVSGLHISIIALTLVRLLEKLRLGKRIPSLIGSLTVIGMMLVTGFSGSVMRAGIMQLVLFLAKMLVRRADGINSIGLAATLLLISNPYNLFNISFLLSSFATLGILMFTDKAESCLTRVEIPFKPLNKLYSYLTTTLSVTLCAQIFVLPFSIFYFGYISTISPIANIALSPIIPFAIWLPLIMLLTYKTPFVSVFTSKITAAVTVLFRDIVTFFASFKLCGFRSGDTMLAVYAVVACLLIIAAFVLRKHKITVCCLLMSAVILVLPALALQAKIDKNTVRYTFYPSESGICMTAEIDKKAAVFISDYSYDAISAVNKELSNRNITEITALFITSDDAYAATCIADSFSLKRNVKHCVAASGGKYTEMCEGTVKLFGVLNVEIVYEYDGWNLLIDCFENNILFCAAGDSNIKTDYVLCNDAAGFSENKISVKDKNVYAHVYINKKLSFLH